MQCNVDTIHTIQVEVVYAKPEHQTIITLNLPIGSTVQEAIHQSGILAYLSVTELDTLAERLGIFGEKVSLSRLLKNGDRVEIYRSLKKDPKEARRERAYKQQHLKIIREE